MTLPAERLQSFDRCRRQFRLVVERGSIQIDGKNSFRKKYLLKLYR